MAVTYAQFVAAHPEFAKTEEFPQAAVEQALVDAELWHSAELYGAKLSLGVRLRAAHSLAISSHGEQARMTVTTNGEPPITTPYLVEWERLRRTIPAGPIVV